MENPLLKVKWTSVAHYVGGFLSALLSIHSPVLAIMVTLVFLVYELNEDWYLTDEAFKDLKEYLFGMFAGGIIIIGTQFIMFG